MFACLCGCVFVSCVCVYLPLCVCTFVRLCVGVWCFLFVPVCACELMCCISVFACL